LLKEEAMMFDLNIEYSKANTNNDRSHRKMSALDAATTVVMEERQRCASAPAKINMPTMTTKANTAATAATAADAVPTTPNPIPETETETKLRAALVASLEQSTELEPQIFPSDPDRNSRPSPSSPTTGHITFGSKQLSALSPEIQHDEVKRQESLVKPHPAASLSLTTKRRLSFRDDRSGAIVRDEELVMSGALDWADVRCEVCAARERAMSGLEEAGIVAL
jgi:hypothetical protein